MDVEVEEVVVEGSTLNVTCNAREGNPSHVDKYKWDFESKYTGENIEPEFECEKRSCIIEDVSPKHAGKYICTATNWDGYYETTSSAETTVLCK